jgi:alkylation response protein AidB-like acyl-CoA dehydrogenase
VRDLAPLIAQHADEAERERRLARPVVDALINAGVFRLFVPPTLGGAGASPLEFCEVVEAVSTVDGSTGWCVMISGGYGQFAGLLPSPAATEIFGDPGAVVSGTFRPNGVARAVAGGYQASGQWPLASGSSHATWLLGGCRIVDSDQPRLTPAGRPEVRLVFLPVADAAILDTWHTAGLRGTASNDFVLRDRFIPAHRTCWFTHAPARTAVPAAGNRVVRALHRVCATGHCPPRHRSIYGPRGGEDADLAARPPARESGSPAGRGPG